ncbi:hypothetical protein [Bacteroides acidifaciens]|uniref:hypothetical protein n=1 Tax=Bacteroides acidifaciens TaxID=85831 RepID=UPI003F69244E
MTVKLASTHFYDNLPTTGKRIWSCIRDVELEKRSIGRSSQDWGWVHNSEVNILLTMYVSSRLPRHGGILSGRFGRIFALADRNSNVKINKEGIWIEKLDSNPGELIPAELRQAGEGDVVKIDLNRPMPEILKRTD